MVKLRVQIINKISQEIEVDIYYFEEVVSKALYGIGKRFKGEERQIPVRFLRLFLRQEWENKLGLIVRIIFSEADLIDVLQKINLDQTGLWEFATFEFDEDNSVVKIFVPRSKIKISG